MSDHQKTLDRARQQLSGLIDAVRQEEAAPRWVGTLETVLRELDALSHQDHLTGVLNRRAFVRSLDHELVRALRTGHSFTLAVLAIDDLEGMLEREGQAAAREAVRQFGRQLAAQLRTLDCIGRVAANEFALLLPTTWLDQAPKALLRLQQSLSRAPETAALSFSAGLTANTHKDRPDALLARASQALARARTRGARQNESIDPPVPEFDPDVS